MSPKASATAMIVLLVLALIVLGALSAFVKIQLELDDQEDSKITGMAVAEPVSEQVDRYGEDTIPPAEPKFSIS